MPYTKGICNVDIGSVSSKVPRAMDGSKIQKGDCVSSAIRGVCRVTWLGTWAGYDTLMRIQPALSSKSIGPCMLKDLSIETVLYKAITPDQLKEEKPLVKTVYSKDKKEFEKECDKLMRDGYYIKQTECGVYRGSPWWMAIYALMNKFRTDKGF